VSDLVECRSEHAYAQRPTAFEWDGERLKVENVEAQWQTPGAKHFRVRTTEMGIFELVYDQDKNRWEISQP